MIVFKTVRWKNFLSTGNIFSEISLNENGNTLIIGENGAGKSTILDAICFGLFGKPFRKINKSGLLNSVNQKEGVVEIEFRTNNKDYKIVRGIKPNKFEIYADGIMLNQDSASKDYQDHLETFILKMNMKSFTQIVILGSASFTPFMQLSPGDRRTVIEDLLDIQIFSTMNVIAKQRMQANRDALERNRLEIGGKDEKMSYIEKTLGNLRLNNVNKLAEYEAQLNEYNEKKKAIIEEVETISKERETLIDEIGDSDERRKSYQAAVKEVTVLESDMKRLEKEKSFLSKSDNCPTCKQIIDEAFKKDRIVTIDGEVVEKKDECRIHELNAETLLDVINKMEEKAKRVQEIKTQISAKKELMKHLLSNINGVNDAIEKIKSADDLISNNEEELEIVQAEIHNLNTEKNELLDERQYIETAINLLKDGGIKTKIIKQYLPIINKLINKYLSQMGFFVNFNINESFEETIKSRYRDEFQYANFSEGEKMRIDLALLFTWRTIAKMRNSVNTNLLILDEVLDSSLDGNGTDEFLKIMWSMVGDTNTFVISHKQDQLFDKFQKVIKFVKIKNFSQIAS